MSLRESIRGRKTYGYQPRIPIRDRRSRTSIATHPVPASALEGASDGSLLPKSITRTHKRDATNPVQEALLNGYVGLDQAASDTHMENVEADDLLPKPRRGRPSKAKAKAEIVPIVEETELAKTVEKLRRDLYGWRQAVAHRVATINRLRAICRAHVVQHMGLNIQTLYSKGEELKTLKIEKDHKIMQTEAAALYAALFDEKLDHKLVFTMINHLSMVDAIKSSEKDEAKIEREMAKTAKQLPVAKWADGQFGFSLVGLAKIVGYAGDLNRYCDPDTKRIMPSKLWKFMELAVINGERQRRVGGEAALEHNYKGHKRSLMWNIGGSLIGGMGRGPRLSPDQEIRTADLHPWQRRFYQHMRFYADRNPELHRKPIGENGKESFSKHAWAMSKRRVEKEFLVALQIAWRDATKTEMPT